MGVGERIRWLRENRDWSQLYLAEKLGIHNSVLSRIEAGKKGLDNDLLMKLAEIFGVSVDYILGRTDDPTPPESPKNKLPPLTEKDKRDIARDLEKIMASLESKEALAFYGEPIDDETKELIKISLENSMRLAKQLAKAKFTPKKYRK